MTEIDRLGIRDRPRGRGTMLQTWYQLLFLHWPADPEALRRHLPAELEVDTFDGSAWVGLIPFGMRDIRAPLVPPVPGLSATLEVNVRTYVHRRGVPGVWFFSLDASHPVVVWAARRFFHLPYFRARMSQHREAERIEYRSRRAHRGAAPAHLDLAWEVAEARPPAETDGLDFFLTERYCLYTAHGTQLWRGRIHHPPWPLRSAEVGRLESSMLAAHGLEVEAVPPLARYAEELAVEIWPLERMGSVDEPDKEEGRWRTGQRA